MNLKQYIEQLEKNQKQPCSGDEFDFQINEVLSIETTILSSEEDSITVEIDEAALEYLDELNLLEDVDSTTFHYAIEYQIGGSDADATIIMRVIDVPYTGNMKTMYPEYVRGQINRSPINKEMKARGAIEKRTAGVWQGSIDDAINDLKEKLKDPQLIQGLRTDWTKELNQLIFTKAHMSGQPYKTSYGKPTEETVTEAEYQGREVKLGKPMRGDIKKYKVFVKDPKSGNVKKVNFGDPNMEIKRDDPKRRKSFRARHGCGTARASDRTKAAYWSCRMWSNKPVSSILKGK